MPDPSEHLTAVSPSGTIHALKEDQPETLCGRVASALSVLTATDISMPDPDTQKAINETLRNVRQRLGDQYEKNKRLGTRGSTYDPIPPERMSAYRHAMQIVSRFIRPVSETDEPDE